MSGIKQILSAMTIYAGAFATWIMAPVNDFAAPSLQEFVTLSVGIATLVFTILKCIEIAITLREKWQKRKLKP